ncbi:CLUMA_CG001027, isoform A [Clunio marinus]|uniref:CLUMA_CG001027, isoform A n=1 Tax=Clunio marinus TaxID=568069 RepID=A0A1J1HGT3_9DIPT|nr:CLUMA_CG001027, isoform A [Clunio marinus]
MAAMVSMSNLLNGKDSRWLQLEVCREYQRNKCSRPDTECKFAPPPATVEVQNGRVTACYDSIKARCNREKPPCKYFHPPQHLKDQLLINGRNHLALKNALMQQMGMAPPTPAPTILQPSPLQPMTANRYLPASNPYNPYFGHGLLPITIGPEHAASALAGSPLPQTMSIATNAGTQPQKRTDRVQSGSTPLPATSSSANGKSLSSASYSASILANLMESGKKRAAECLQRCVLETKLTHKLHTTAALTTYKKADTDKPLPDVVSLTTFFFSYQTMLGLTHFNLP